MGTNNYLPKCSLERGDLHTMAEEVKKPIKLPVNKPEWCCSLTTLENQEDGARLTEENLPVGNKIYGFNGWRGEYGMKSIGPLLVVRLENELLQQKRLLEEKGFREVATFATYSVWAGVITPGAKGEWHI